MKIQNRGILPLTVFGIFAFALDPGDLKAGGANSFVQRNLVSDIPGLADHTDANLVNPWGIAFTPTSPFWVADNHAGVSTLYNSVGQPLSLVVALPPPGDAPTGAVFNSGGAFNGDFFIFASEGGGITGWRGALGNTAEVLFDNSGA